MKLFVQKCVSRANILKNVKKKKMVIFAILNFHELNINFSGGATRNIYFLQYLAAIYPRKFR